MSSSTLGFINELLGFNNHSTIVSRVNTNRNRLNPIVMNMKFLMVMNFNRNICGTLASTGRWWTSTWIRCFWKGFHNRGDGTVPWSLSFSTLTCSWSSGTTSRWNRFNFTNTSRDDGIWANIQARHGIWTWHDWLKKSSKEMQISPMISDRKCKEPILLRRRLVAASHWEARMYLIIVGKMPLQMRSTANES